MQGGLSLFGVLTHSKARSPLSALLRREEAASERCYSFPRVGNTITTGDYICLTMALLCSQALNPSPSFSMEGGPSQGTASSPSAHGTLEEPPSRSSSFSWPVLCAAFSPCCPSRLNSVLSLLWAANVGLRAPLWSLLFVVSLAI